MYAQSVLKFTSTMPHYGRIETMNVAKIQHLLALFAFTEREEKAL